MVTSHLHALRVWMCFSAARAEMNLSLPVVQLSSVWNPVWGILIRFFLCFEIWRFTKILSAGYSAIRAISTFRTVFFCSVWGWICLFKFRVWEWIFGVCNPGIWNKSCCLQCKEEGRVLGGAFATGDLLKHQPYRPGFPCKELMGQGGGKLLPWEVEQWDQLCSINNDNKEMVLCTWAQACFKANGLVHDQHSSHFGFSFKSHSVWKRRLLLSYQTQPRGLICSSWTQRLRGLYWCKEGETCSRTVYALAMSMWCLLLVSLLVLRL